METVKAIIIKNRGRQEVRCANCGKLLFFYEKSVDNVDNSVDNSSRNVTIVARCTRNDCKKDNTLQL